MKQAIRDNPIIHWSLVVNKLNNYQRTLSMNASAESLIEETKLIIQELVWLVSEQELLISKLLFEDNITWSWIWDL